MKNISRLSLTIVLTIIVALSTESLFAVEDQSEYGNSYHPIWSQVTVFEDTTLAQADAAQQGDADALLRLYLMASGDVRDEKSFRQISDKINRWLTKVEPLIQTEAGRWEQGDRLNRLMHRDFFLAGRLEDEQNAGYNYDQSQLSEVFRSKTYNCVSASLLYAILANKLDLNTRGVLLPSHAFVELEISPGKFTEVETTSDSGFGIKHDEAFYQKTEFQKWYSARGIEPSTYQDYLKRRHISLFELGVQNMSNQHVSPERMAYTDRMRLVEFISELSPDNILALKIRLGFYTREYSRLQQTGDYAILDRMYETISPFLDRVMNMQSADAEQEELLSWVNSQRAITAIYNKRYIDGVALIKEMLVTLNPQLEDYTKIRNNLYFAFAEYAKAEVKSGHYDSVRQSFSGIENDCLVESVCAGLFGHLYSEWAGYYWRQADWSNVINRYTEYLRFKDSGDVAALFRENMQNAYLNWSNEFSKTGDWSGASEVLQQCFNYSSIINQCQERFEKLQAYKNR